MDSYSHGTDPLFKIDFNSFLNALGYGVQDVRADTPYSTTSTSDTAWRGRRNRMPGSRIAIAGYVDRDVDHFWNGLRIEDVAGIRANYNPTFIPLTSALGATLNEQRGSLNGFLNYVGSPFDRVWYPIERKSCPSGSAMPCDPPNSPSSWYHDAADIIANRDSKGIDDKVGNGQDTAYGFEFPQSADHTTSTLSEFISRATDSRWPYEAMEALNAIQPRGGLELTAWHDVPGDDIRTVNFDNLGRPALIGQEGRRRTPTTYHSRPEMDWFENYEVYKPNSVVRMRGFFVPRITGIYQFRLSARPSALFKLSQNEFDENLRTLASVAPPGINRTVWDAQNSQLSRPILLNGGSRYYFEIHFKVGANLDGPNYAHFELEWLPPDLPRWRYPVSDEIGVYRGRKHTRYPPMDPPPVTKIEASRKGNRDTIKWRVPAQAGHQYESEVLWQNSIGQSGTVRITESTSTFSHTVEPTSFYAYWIRISEPTNCNAVLRPCPTLTSGYPSTTEMIIVPPRYTNSTPRRIAGAFTKW